MSLTYKKPDKNAVPLAEFLNLFPKKSKEADQPIYRGNGKIRWGKHKRFVYYDDSDDTDGDRVTNLSLEDPKDTTFRSLPYIVPSQRQSSYISGKSGSGKSFFIRDYIRNMHKLYPATKKQKIYLFTGSRTAAEDNVYKKFKNLCVILINEVNPQELAEVTHEEFSDCTVIFDDWEVIDDKYVADFIQRLIRALLNYTRKQNVTLLFTTHKHKQGHRTADIIFDCDQYVLFPKFGIEGILKFLETYADISSKSMKERIKNLRTRTLVVRNVAPNVLISDTDIFLL